MDIVTGEYHTQRHAEGLSAFCFFYLQGFCLLFMLEKRKNLSTFVL